MSIAYSLLSAVYLAFINEALQLTLLSQNTSRAEQPSGSARFHPSPAFPSLHPWRRGEPRYPQPEFKNAKQRAAYNRLVYNIKKVLPIAKEANKIIIETYEYLETLPNKKAKDAHMKLVEKDIIKEYKPRMKKLTYAQGKLLIKLIYRECNSSTYNLIKAFLGPVRSGFYQAFAWTFGASLTKKYDPEGVDKLTERVILQVEAGQL